jgi:hypothetical protein
MGYDDRYGDNDRDRTREREQWRGQGREQGGREQDRGFFERAGDTVGSWFGGDEDRGDGRQDYGRQSERQYGGERGQTRGSGGGFRHQEDYGQGDRYRQQGESGFGGLGEDGRYGGAGGAGGGSGGMPGGGASYGSVGVGSGSGEDSHSVGGLGAAPEFSGGPRFDRQDAGWTGSHGVHPVSSSFGDAQRDPYGAETIGGGAGGSSARERAILQQAERNGGRGRIEPGEQAPGAQQARYGQAGQYGQSGGQQQRSRFDHDPHYHEWRSRHIESLDRDYDEYRRENASRFESEFGSWREKRGQQRQHMGRAKEHMEVVGSDGQHVGTVDKVAGDRIILTKNDANAGGHHHSIPCSWIENVDDKVTISKTADEAMAAWRDEETSRALFEKPDSGSDGPHILDRSFSGTYQDGDKR